MGSTREEDLCIGRIVLRIHSKPNRKEGKKVYSLRKLLKGKVLTVLCLTAVCAMLPWESVFAELQSVQVGGELRIRGRYYINTWQDPFITRASRVSNNALGKRPIGANGVSSIFKWDKDGADWSRYETSVLLNVKADFTDDVSAFFEIYDFHVWGEDFRSNYVTGVDNRAVTNEDVEINQAYIETRNTFGYPVRLRVGRQNLKFGKGWLVTDMLTPSQYASHDAIRLTYAVDDWTVDAFASKLADTVTGDDDTDFYGIYGTYSGLEAISLSAYWYFLRDANKPDDSPNSTPVFDWWEDLLGWNQYENTNMHTVGLRANGVSSGFDYDLELAYQFGDAASHGTLFKPVGWMYGDDDAKYDNWGGELTLGYTFADVKWSPRIYTMGVYFGGEDNRDISFWDWMNPFYRPQASVCFNRLFGDKNYMPVINDNGWMSNFSQIQLGVEAKPTEKIKVHLHVAKDWANEPFDFPVYFTAGGQKVAWIPPLSFWTEEGSDDLGWELAAWLKYDYSKDLWFLLYGNYLWVGDGLTDGAFSQFNGTDFTGGSDNDDAAYVFWMAVLRF